MKLQLNLTPEQCEILGIAAEWSNKPVQIIVSENDPEKRRKYQNAYRGNTCKYFAEKLGVSRDEANDYIMKHLNPTVTFTPEEGFAVDPGSTENFTHSDFKILLDRAEQLAFLAFNEMPNRNFEI